MRTMIVVPPGPGGVTDYANAIGNCLPGAICLPFDPRVEPETDAVFLQYSGYGYHKRGIPFRLLDWIDNLPAKKKVGIYFHELSASGWPWSSAFWLSAVQRYIVWRLLQRCDFWMTNTAIHYARLMHIGGRKPNCRLPVCSNVGELQTNTSERQRALVTFGSAALRQRLYGGHGSTLAAFCRTNMIEVWDIGTPISDKYFAPLSEHAINVRVHGRLPVQQVHAALGSAQYGAMDYPVQHLEKSGVFAAYCAHGLVPLVVNSSGAAASLEEHAPYVPLTRPLLFGAAERTTRSQRAFGYYADHGVQRHADSLEALLASVG